MIVIETNAGCPLGLVAAIALEQLGEAYDVRLFPEGHFITTHGAPGPRIVTEGGPAAGSEAVAALVERCLRAMSASGAALHVHDHMRRRVGPAFVRFVRSAESTRQAAHADLRAELEALDTLVAVVPRADWTAGALASVLAPLDRSFRREPSLRAAFPELARRTDELATAPSYVRARAKIAARSRGLASPDEILAFWFDAPIGSEADAIARARRWFMGGESMDREVRARFMPTVEAALRGELDHWSVTVRGRLALVIVLDQLTRNAYRGDPRTWSGDARALALSIEALDRGLEAELDFVERLFLAMPLHHAEDRAILRRSVEHAKRAAESAPPHLVRLAEAGLEQAEKYERIVEQFGRFPFRNAVLGRESTDEERAFLADFASKGPPRMMRAEADASSGNRPD